MPPALDFLLRIALAIQGLLCFFHSEGCLLNLVTVSFAVQKLFSLMQSHCSFFLLDAEPFEFYLGNYSLYLYVPLYFLLLLRVVSKFQALC
jgi:hypothetical protein